MRTVIGRKSPSVNGAVPLTHIQLANGSFMEPVAKPT